MGNVLGIDVSKWQGEMDWGKAYDAGVRFAYIKATEGNNVIDSQAVRNWEEAGKWGVLRGFYHFFRGGVSGKEQALWHKSVTAGMPCELPGANDVEVRCDAAQVWQFCNEIGPECVIYTSAGLWTAAVGDRRWGSKHPLWVANWDVERPSLPLEWKDWVIWQYSSKGNGWGSAFGAVGSKDIDLNYAKPEWIAKYGELKDAIPGPDPAGEIARAVGLQMARVVSDVRVRWEKDVNDAANIVGTLPRGIVVRIESVHIDGENVWGRLGAGLWGAMRYGGKEYMEWI